VATHARHRGGLALRLVRSERDRIVAGVAGGLGERLEVDPAVLRLAFVVLAFAGGFGLLAYLFLWLTSSEPVAGADHPSAARPFGPDTQRVVAVALVVGGALLILRETGLWFGDAIVWPVALAGLGSAVIWTRSEGVGRARLARVASRVPRGPLAAAATWRTSRARLAVGALLVAGGMTAFLAANDALPAIRNVVFAMAVTASGLGLIIGPWVWRMGRQLADERRQRIRSEERAEVAAHLHDSVLQTLALIQRSSSQEEMATLARGQERELRAWLYADDGRAGPRALSAALGEAAARIEQLHHVIVDTVVVGDCPVDERVRAVLDACGEAMSNAARHSGAQTISVYVEVLPEAVDAYVRDEGSGFAVLDLPNGRRGIAESIRGRMERNGGVATVVSERGEGTEVHLRMPRKLG
jgi:signal transduction histidine kinase/phage shock protein PspC (stress-responsive transcriptional regulator)